MPDPLARRAAHTINDALFQSVRLWLAQNYPGWLPDELILALRDPFTHKKRKVRFPIAMSTPQDTQPAPQDARPIEENILEAIGRQTLPMRKIAEESGYSYGGHLKETVAKLVRDGKLEKTLDGFRRPVPPA